MTNFTAEAISVQGYSHKLVGKECQDSSLAWKSDAYSACIVCDGHGGEKYIRSAFGSKTACEVGRDMIKHFMIKHSMRKSIKSLHYFDNELTFLENSIIGAWRGKIEADININPISNDVRFSSLEDNDKKSLEHNPIKAYGTTFIAAVLTDNYCFIIKLGDGNAVVFDKNENREMPEDLKDDDLQFNMTTSLCSSDASSSFRHHFRFFNDETSIKGITLTSDGVINCYHSEKSYFSFMGNVFKAYTEDDIYTARNELSSALDLLSEKGSGDDLSVAVIINIGDNESKTTEAEEANNEVQQ